MTTIPSTEVMMLGTASDPKRAYGVDVHAEIRCAVLAKDEGEACKLAEAEIRKLLAAAPVVAFYIDIRKLDAKLA